jgi:hypothetical protein
MNAPAKSITAIAGKQRRALMILAVARDGPTETLMKARGFSTELMAGLVGAGLATRHVEHITNGQRSIEVVRVRVTQAGRRALAMSRRVTGIRAADPQMRRQEPL